MPKTPQTKQKIFWIALPVLVWMGLFCLRPVFFHPWCAVQPTPCTVDAVNAFDQIVFQFHSKFADFLSNLVQNTVGVFLFLLPVLLIRDWKRVLRLEFFLLIGTLWDGALIELARAIAQRPRPLVMNSPMGDGANINQYTSFYSGHTSFVAFAGVSTFLWMGAVYGKSHARTRLAGILAITLILLTASLRVLGGRHFPTDTLAGAVAGSLVAVMVWSFAKRDLMNTLDLNATFTRPAE